MSSFWQRRVVPYSVGALEFLQNLLQNVQDAVTGRSDSQQPLGDFSGRVALITGGNAGIGRSTAAAIYQRGGAVVLACRSRSRGETAVQAIQQLQPVSGCSSGSCEMQELDLSSLRSVQSFTQAWKASGRQLDMLFCNAGIMAPHIRADTADGLEQQFQVNYLGHWRLAHDLVASQTASGTHSDGTKPERKNARLRVIWLTSMTHIGAHLDFEDLQLRKGYSGFLGYANSKLAGILATKEFQRRMDRCSNIQHQRAVFCAVHPGFVNTDLANGWLTGSDAVPAAVQQVIRPLVRAVCPWILIPPSKAVQTILYAASAPAAEVKGQYIAGGRVVQPSKQAQDPQLGARLWDSSRRLSDTTVAPCFQ